MSKKILPISLVVTVLNEAATIDSLITAIANQTQLPTELIVVDGGSSDKTFSLLKSYGADFPTKLKVSQKKGNRSVGRNAAIDAATQSIIACTDAGCIPHPDWLEQLYATHTASEAAVVAGYYRGIAKSHFGEAVIPYALVMPDRVNPSTFLPATRSMLFTKEAWQVAGKFNEYLSDNEDYAFAHQLKKNKIKIIFTQSAVVDWQPRETVRQFFWMILRFARGDVQAHIIRPKVLLVFGRYLGGLVVAWLLWQQSIQVALLYLVLAISLYAVWAICKNIRFVPTGWYWLPLLQGTADLGVIIGSSWGAVLLLLSFGTGKHNNQN